MSEERVQVDLTTAEAIVLYEFLRHFDDEVEFTFRDQAEQRALWNLECLLEKKLKIVTAPDYLERWKAACDAVRDKEE